MMELLNDAIRRFNERAESDPKVQSELAGITRKIQLKLEDETYNITFENMRMGTLETGEIDEPDISIVSERETVTGILKGEIGPMKAWAMKNIKIKSPIEDLLRFRKLLSSQS